MLIKMTTNAKGCDDGIHCHEYEAGNQYDVSENLAHNFIVMNVAEIVGEKADAPHANKSLDESNYENKSTRRRR